jgi:CubicO group peptidase (beta-lactamase class C family)
MKLILSSILTLGILFAQPCNAATSTSEEVVKQLNQYLKELAAKNEFSGSVLLAKGEDVLVQEAYGLASKRFNVPNNIDTKFNLGSMNKMFTSIGIMQLVESGKLSLSDKLSDFIDENWLSKKISQKIQITNLLDHTSGLDNYFNRTYMNTSKNNFRKLDDYKPLIVDSSLLFEPGSEARYSNTGMFMLGVVIEKVSGEDYFSYIRKNIYQKAKMVNSDSYEMDQPISNLAIGYEPNDKNETGWKNNNYIHVLKGGPAGGGFSTVQDLHNFALALTNYKLVSKKLTDESYSVKSKLSYVDYGYGFNVRGEANNRIVGHGGGFPGIGSNLDIFLDQGYIAVVMSNYGRGDRDVRNKIRELLKK